jgi:glycosyltransferase involved in cell wall biosynthesis
LAATLAEVLADPAELRRLGECGRQAVAERFSDAAMAREVLAETRFLLAHSPSPALPTRA